MSADAVASYRISLLAEDGSLAGEHVVDCEHDDAAIESAGDIDHPLEMSVWDGERLVASFPPRSRPGF